MKHVLTFKATKAPVYRFPGFIPAEAAAWHVHVDDDEASPAGQEGLPVHAPPLGHGLTARPLTPQHWLVFSCESNSRNSRPWSVS